jgi:hypothetical protein
MRWCWLPLCGLLLTVSSDRAVLARTPTQILVELFTSEGCSSCPPADTFLQRMIDSQPLPDARIIGLGQHVTYWDQKGWRDRFSSAVLTERQEHYGAALHAGPIYTPQMVIDGRFGFVGSDTKEGRRAIEQALALPHGSIEIALASLSANRVAVSVSARGLPGVAPGDRADIVVAITEDGLRSNVRGGENGGRTLAHAAVVRRLTTIGEAVGERPSARTELSIDRDWSRENVKIVAFVQERASRHVLAASVVALR